MSRVWGGRGENGRAQAGLAGDEGGAVQGAHLGGAGGGPRPWGEGGDPQPPGGQWQGE